jgi:hypothetical protein
MEFKHTMRIIIAAVTVTIAVSTAVTYLLYKLSLRRANDEKWKEYTDCGLA